MERGHPLEIVARQSGFSSLRILDDLIAPPPHSAFYVLSSVLAGGCDRPLAEDEEDGCPCDTF